MYREAKDMFLLLFLLSGSFMYAVTPPDYKDIDDEMRSYVKYSVEFMGYDPGLFASHVTSSPLWAAFNYFNNGGVAFYVITFDRDFIEKQPTHIKKAIAAHEVGHGYDICAKLSSRYRRGLSTYLEKENCADVLSALIYSYQATLEGLKRIKARLPNAIQIDARIKLLEIQLGDDIENPDNNLTYWDE